MKNIDIDFEIYKDIVFYEDGHKYINSLTNKELISVTTAKKDFIHPFDSNIAIGVAKKRGVSVDTIKKEWAEAGRIGRERGTLLHHYCENLSKRKVIKLDMSAYPHMHNLVNQIHHFFNDHQHWIWIAVECVIGDEINAGQFDGMVYDNTLDEIYIIDFKFQKSFRESYGKFMKPPYDIYPQDTLHEYSWQMSKYKDILSKGGIEVDGMKLIHFNYEDIIYKIYDAINIKII